VHDYNGRILDAITAMAAHTWIWWFRFALEVLELDEPEAREYADRRSLEDENRERVRDRAA
jgi:hypothetical protein